MLELPVGAFGVRGSWHGEVCRSFHDGGRIRILICCPICGMDSCFDFDKITLEGIVTPVFYCPYSCGCRLSLRLLGWDEWLTKALREDPPGIDPGTELGPGSNYS